MAEDPSEYEQRAWRDLHGARATRPASKAAHAARGYASRAAQRAGTTPFVRKAREKAKQSQSAAADAMPEAAKAAAAKGARVVGKVAEGSLRALARLGSALLNEDWIVRSHQRRGHLVTALGDLRSLDLEQIDAVRPRSLDLAYAAGGALVGAGAGLAITGGEIAVGSGAGAAPALGFVVGVTALDTAAVLTLSSTVAAHTALYYGYDPTRPQEKLFLLSVVNLGTAATASAKMTAFADISRLTQMLYRGATWSKMNSTVMSKIAQRFAGAFGIRLTKRGLGRLLPVAGIAVGTSLNWLTVEQVADAADFAYRRRFLLDKYPHLRDDTAAENSLAFVMGLGSLDDIEDEDITVLGIAIEEGLELPGELPPGVNDRPDAETA